MLLGCAKNRIIYFFPCSRQTQLRYCYQNFQIWRQFEFFLFEHHSCHKNYVISTFYIIGDCLPVFCGFLERISTL